MKKVLATLLVALLVASTVFAGFTGSFETQYKADFAGKNYGFVNGPGSLKLTFDKVLGGTKNEAAITGKIAAAVSPKLDKAGNLNLGLAVTEASINGENWKIDIAQMAGLPSYAGGFVAREYATGKFATQNLDASVGTTAGITGIYDGWKLGLGMNFKAAGAASTKSIYVLASPALVDLTEDNKNTILDANGKPYGDNYVGSTVLSYVKKDITVAPTAEVKELAATFNMKQLAFAEDSLKLDAYAGVKASSGKKIDLGFGAKVAFAQDKLSASVGSDMVLAIAGDKTKFDADVAANFAYDFVNAGVYYATKACSKVGPSTYNRATNLLDVKVGFDLKSFEVPLSLTVAATDIINDGRGILVNATSAFMEGASVSADFDMTFKTVEWNAKVAGTYTIEDIAKLSASVGLGGNKAKAVNTVSLSVAAENTTLIENTTLKLGYDSANFLDKANGAGAVTASVGIKF